MARQVRSEATRRKILDAAIDVFNEVGYGAAGRSAIIARTEMTKGAFNHHFGSMETLASAIIDEGSQIVLNALANVCQAPSPALENMIHGTFVSADLFLSDPLARAAQQLLLELCEFNESASRVYGTWLATMAVQAGRAIEEGDLRPGLDPDTLSGSLIAALVGAQVLCKATSGRGLVERLSRLWELLLPAIATESALPYFREFLARESLRHAQPPPTD
jgi:AcrR family transcriptional regulator